MIGRKVKGIENREEMVRRGKIWTGKMKKGKKKDEH